MKILLAEDEKDLSRALVAVMTHKGYEVDPVYDGQEAVEHASAGSYDCMVFDIMMPRKDGITALKELREAGDTTPVLMLTAKAELDDRVAGLDAGADDYLAKPFAMTELLARIRSLLRRAEGYTPREMKFAGITLDIQQLELRAENAVRLGGKEAKLMEMFMRNAEKEITTEEIFQHVWKDEPEADPGIVWVYVSFLKSKLMSIQGGVEILGEPGESFRLVKAEG